MEAAIKVALAPDASSIVHDMTVSMESFAAAGNWERTAEIAASLRHAVMQVPEALRRETLLAAQRCLKQVHGVAHAAKSDVSSQLSALRRGQDATRAYTHAN